VAKPTKDAAPAKVQFPQRDADGRVTSFADMAVGVAVYLVIGLVLLVVIDAVSAAAAGRFGEISGWLGGIMAVWLFVEDFRAWGRGADRVGALRWAVAFAGVLLGGLAGALLGAQLTAWPNLASGALGVLLACALYAAIWFFGIRVVADRH
jgi:hypothetical protein